MRTDPRGVMLAAAICASAACVQTEFIQPQADELIVHAVIDMDARDQYVVVQHTTGALGVQGAVTGATVTITTPDGRVLLADEVRDTTMVPAPLYAPKVSPVYRISLDRYGVTLAGGATYRLRVVLAGGAREATGATTLPAYPLVKPVTPPRQEFDRARDTVTVVWPRVTSARSYEVSVVTSFGLTFAAFADTSIVLTGRTENSINNLAFRAPQAYQVVVNAVDANYYDYYRRSSDLFTGSSVVNRLNGATGVFGAVVRVSTRVLDVR